MIKGRNFTVGFDRNDGTTTVVALAKSCTFESNANTSDVSTKDDDESGCEEVTSLDWGVDVDCLVAESFEGSGIGASSFTNIVLAGSRFQISFMYEAGYGVSARPGEGFKLPQTGKFRVYGEAIVESVKIDAKNKEKVSMSVHFKGAGPYTVQKA